MTRRVFGFATETVRASYSLRAEEYIERFGLLEGMSPIDRQAIREWALGINGCIVDAGSGPGHWTEYLHRLGMSVAGVEMVPEFFDSARKRFPEVDFRLGTIEELPFETGSISGLLAWYSVIHAEPAQLPVILNEFARCLVPGGSLLLGFFEGSCVEPFGHAVVTAYFWPVDDMTRLLNGAGFEVVDVQARTDLGCRPHAVFTAELRH